MVSKRASRSAAWAFDSRLTLLYRNYSRQHLALGKKRRQRCLDLEDRRSIR